MRKHPNYSALIRRKGIALSIGLVTVLAPCAALAGDPPAQTCNALVSIANNLYLVDNAGKMLVQFTSDGTTKAVAALAPDGTKVAYVTPDLSAQTYEVVNEFRQQGTYPIYEVPKRDDPHGFVARSTFQSLSWASRDVLGVMNSAGKDYGYFLFRRIPDDLSPAARLIAKPSMADGCAVQPRGHELACIDSGGSVFWDGGNTSGQNVFSVSGFEGIKPEESFTLGVGESANTQGTTPSYTVTLISVDKNEITLRISPPNGAWEQPNIENGGYTTNLPVLDYNTYGFFATIVNRKAGLVRIDAVKSYSPDNIFDPALTWTPDGHGLLLIRRTNTQAALYLISPGGEDHRWKEGRDDRWTLTAQVPINLPGTINSMRFATPSLLLLKDEQNQFSEVPIEISHSDGTETLSLGAVTALPSTLTVSLNGTSTQGAVLDWSCKIQSGDNHDGDN